VVTCAGCGTENEPGRKFCRECGSRLSTGCPTCGTVNAPDAKFCGECGTALARTDGVPSTAGAILAGTGRVAERRFVSVLFADLVEFTPFAEGRDAEETRDLLSRYFEISRTVVERYGGTIEKFIGDAVMAVWGAPTSHEDDAERAVRAALELVDAVLVLGDGVRARAAVLSGEAAVTIGAVGEGLVAGDLVNTAARLQAAAEPGTVLVGDATRSATAGAIAFEDVGETTLKGKSSPVPAWRAVRVVAERGGRGRSDLLEPPFVGRDTEFRLLKDLFHATSGERRPRLVTVTGQAGIGKSRLAWEFLKYVDGLVETVWWHSGRSPAYGDGITFWALGEMVRRRAGLAEDDDEAVTRTRVAETVERFVADEDERRWIEDALLVLLGVGDPGRVASEQLFSAWRTFFERIASDDPVVMVFEDIQWADDGQLDFIEHLLEWSREAPIFVVALARPELLDRRADWGAGRRGLVSIGLEPLDEASVRALLAGLVPGLPEQVTAGIVSKADGIPLYAVEIVRMLLSDGRLVAEDGRFSPAGDLSTLEVPGSLQALISARLDALASADRALVQDAAVLGHSFTVAGLAAVSGERPKTLEPRLKGLVRRELFVNDADPRSPERGQFAFVQGLTREVAYQTLARSDRKTRHLAAARHFESLGTDELAGALAAHYLQALEAAPAGPESDALSVQARLALRGAADRAEALGAQAQVVAFVRQALAITPEPSERAELLERAGRAAAAAFQRDEAEDLLVQAVQLRRDLGDRTAVVRAIRALGRTQLDTYRSDRGLATLEPAVTEFEDLRGEPDYAVLVAELGRACFLTGSPGRAVEVTESILPDLERLDLIEPIADALITKGSALATAGRAREGCAIALGGVEIARTRGFSPTELRGRVNLASLLAIEDPRQAFEVGRAGIELAARLGLRTRQRSLLVNVVWMAYAMGEWDWGLRVADEVAERDPDDPMQATSLHVVAPILFARGIAGAAELERALGRFAGAGGSDLNTQSNVLGLQAQLDVVEGRFSDAYERWRRAADMDPFNRIGALWDAAKAVLWLRDRRRAAETVEAFVTDGTHGRFVDALAVALGAGVAALEGRRDEALSGISHAVDEVRALGTRFIVADIEMCSAVALGQDDPATPALADDARSILGSLGAVRWLERFDAALGDRAAATSEAMGLASGEVGEGVR
jgi:class 3 adenylate cyclase/tetratricopeptide (TPR) repeat protein